LDVQIQVEPSDTIRSIIPKLKSKQDLSQHRFLANNKVIDKDRCLAEVELGDILVVSPLLEKKYQISDKDTNFCSTAPPNQKFKNPVLLGSTILKYKDPMIERLKWIKFYFHPECPIDIFTFLVKLETDLVFWQNPQQQEIEKIVKLNINKNFSYSTLQKFTMVLLNGNNSRRNVIDDNILGTALKEEHEFRVSKKTQERFSQAELSLDHDWLDVVNTYQKQLAEKYSKVVGCTSSEFLDALRFQQCKSFLPIWRKFNRAERGYLEEKQITPDCYLYDLNSNEYKTLYEIIDPPTKEDKKRKLTILLAGSFS